MAGAYHRISCIPTILIYSHDVCARIPLLHRDGFWTMPLRVISIQLNRI